MSVSIVQCPLPSLEEKADRFITSIDIHTSNRRSPNGIDSNTGWSCGAEFVLLHLKLDWFPQFRPDIPVGPIKRTVSHPSWTNRIIFCMDDLYVQCRWICRICHCFCCKSFLTLGFDITARSSGLLKRRQISAEILVGRQSQCHGIRTPPQQEPRQHAVSEK